MLLGFKVKNFKSFNELQHFSMSAGKTRNFPEHISTINKHNILKFSAIYGANASGKSNLIKAMEIGKRLLLRNIEEINAEEYFRLIKKNKNLSSYFEYEIEKDGKLYSYGFEININNREIVSEWLLDMTKNKPKIIFERDVLAKTLKTDLKFKNKTSAQRFKICKIDVLDNNKVFFLKEIVRRVELNIRYDASFKDFLNVFYFFCNDLQFIMPNVKQQIKVNYFLENKDSIKNLLQDLGLNIDSLEECDSNINVIKNLMEPNEYLRFLQRLKRFSINTDNFNATLRIDNNIFTITWDKNSEDYDVKVIKILHPNSDVYFDTYEESDGTLRILELMDILFSDNKVFIIDEIDRSLHPSLTARFLKNYFKILKEKNIQLIITTHESRLLDYNILRRDEVWFTDKMKNGATKVYSLEQFKDDARFDRKIDKAYLDGRYGAVPIFMDFPGVKK